MKLKLSAEYRSWLSQNGFIMAKGNEIPLDLEVERQVLVLDLAGLQTENSCAGHNSGPRRFFVKLEEPNLELLSSIFRAGELWKPCGRPVPHSRFWIHQAKGPRTLLMRGVRVIKPEPVDLSGPTEGADELADRILQRIGKKLVGSRPSSVYSERV